MSQNLFSCIKLNFIKISVVHCSVILNLAVCLLVILFCYLSPITMLPVCRSICQHATCLLVYLSPITMLSSGLSVGMLPLLT